MYLPSLTDRAELALNCLTRFGDPSRGRLPYFYTRLSDRPITASLAIWSYGDGLGRSVDALLLLRAMLNQPVDREPDRAMTQTLIALIDADGLSWCPAAPWTLPTAHTRPAWLQQGTLLALTTLYQLTGDETYRKLAERNILAVAGMAQSHPEGYSDFPGEYLTRESGWSTPPDDLMHRHSVFSTSITMPLMRYFRVTGFEPALKMASSLIAWAMRDHDDGNDLFERGHFHCQSRLALAILMRGVITNDSDDVERAESLYLKARKLGTQSGWFPEQINNPEHNRSNLSETCCLTDMLELAILLAEHRDAIYWNDAERYVKNHLMVHQIVDTKWFDELTFTPPTQHVFQFKPGDGGCAQDHELEQAIVGGFAGWGAVTAMSDDTIMSNTNQHCCNAAGARALYDSWYHCVADDGQTLSVNLHIRRSHPAAEIVAQEGETGRLMIHVRQNRSLRIRVPEFASQQEMKVLVNDRDVRSIPDGAFVRIDEVSAGDRVDVSYPNRRHTTDERIAPGLFRFDWLGSTVVSAEPMRGVRPLFVPNRFSDQPPTPRSCRADAPDSLG